MKSIQELQAELANTQQCLKAIGEDIEAVRANKTKAVAKIKEIEAKLAAEQKPKLRHGDYGVFDDIKFTVTEVTETRASFLWQTCHEWSTSLRLTCYQIDKLVVLGNIFDDIKALQEDVTEFETVNRWGDRKIRAKICDGTVEFRIKGGSAPDVLFCTLTNENLPTSPLNQYHKPSIGQRRRGHA